MAMGSDRLNRVQVATARDVVVISWAARDELLERVRRLHGGDKVVRAFEAVGATRPVQLGDEKALVLDVVSHWLNEVGVDELPAGIFDLRNALVDDRDHGQL